MDLGMAHWIKDNRISVRVTKFLISILRVSGSM